MQTFAKANSIRISGSGELGTMGAALLTQQLGEMMMAVMSNGRGLQRAQAPMLGLPHGGRGSGGAGRAGPGAPHSFWLCLSSMHTCALMITIGSSTYTYTKAMKFRELHHFQAPL